MLTPWFSQQQAPQKASLGRLLFLPALVAWGELVTLEKAAAEEQQQCRLGHQSDSSRNSCAANEPGYKRWLLDS